MTDEQFSPGALLARRSRAAQGLPPKLTDPETIAKLARIFATPVPITADEGVATRACGKRSAATPDSAERGAA